MRTFRAWLSRLAGIFDKDKRDRELADELESHLQFHTDENLRRGMSPEEARRQAVIGLGGVEQTKEIYRDRLCEGPAPGGWPQRVYIGGLCVDSLWKARGSSAELALVDLQGGPATLHRS
jgi:hypothetical protein